MFQRQFSSLVLELHWESIVLFLHHAGAGLVFDLNIDTQTDPLQLAHADPILKRFLLRAENGKTIILKQYPALTVRSLCAHFAILEIPVNRSAVSCPSKECRPTRPRLT